MENSREANILDVLAASSMSLTVGKIADLSKMHRVTAAKYLAVLEAKGVVSRRDVGKAKLYSLKEGAEGWKSIGVQQKNNGGQKSVIN